MGDDRQRDHQSADTRAPLRVRAFREEVTVRRDDQTDASNPYWGIEELPPHPDPELGCIRRGLCCQSNPGWFAPGEVERAATHVGVEPDDLVRRYLIIDHMIIEDRRVEVFAPVKVGPDGKPAHPPATRVDRLYQTFPGRCIFFDGDGCRIYEARPFECRGYDCTNEPEDNPQREDIGRMWL